MGSDLDFLNKVGYQYILWHRTQHMHMIFRTTDTEAIRAQSFQYAGRIGMKRLQIGLTYHRTGGLDMKDEMEIYLDEGLRHLREVFEGWSDLSVKPCVTNYGNSQEVVNLENSQEVVHIPALKGRYKPAQGERSGVAA